MRTVAALALAAVATTALTACGSDGGATLAEPTASSSTSPTASATASPSPSESPAPTSAAVATDLADGKHYGRLKAFDPEHRVFTVDVVQLISCPECENDYKIENTNPRLRTMAFREGMKVVVNTLSAEETGSAAEDHEVTHEKFLAYFANGQAQDRLFWFTVQDDLVTALHEQYLP